MVLSALLATGGILGLFFSPPGTVNVAHALASLISAGVCAAGGIGWAQRDRQQWFAPRTSRSNVGGFDGWEVQPRPTRQRVASWHDTPLAQLPARTGGPDAHRPRALGDGVRH